MNYLPLFACFMAHGVSCQGNTFYVRTVTTAVRTEFFLNVEKPTTKVEMEFIAGLRMTVVIFLPRKIVSFILVAN